MEQRLSLVTLGVADIGRARAFYEALGWSGQSPDGEVVFFQAGGMIVGLWGREQLADDSARPGPWRLGRRHPRPQRRITPRRSTQSWPRRSPLARRSVGRVHARLGAATRGSSSIPMVIPGRWPTIPAGRSRPTAPCVSPDHHLHPRARESSPPSAGAVASAFGLRGRLPPAPPTPTPRTNLHRLFAESRSQPVQVRGGCGFAGVPVRGASA